MTTANSAFRYHTSHWVVFSAEVQGGVFVGVKPFEKDGDLARVFNDRGDLLAGIAVSDGVL